MTGQTPGKARSLGQWAGFLEKGRDSAGAWKAGVPTDGVAPGVPGDGVSRKGLQSQSLAWKTGGCGPGETTGPAPEAPPLGALPRSLKVCQNPLICAGGQAESL